MRLRCWNAVGVGLALVCAGAGAAKTSNGNSGSVVERVGLSAGAGLAAGPLTSSVAGATDSAQNGKSQKTEAGPSAAPQDDKSRGKDFWGRLGDFYRADWKPSTEAGPSPAAQDDKT